MKSKLLTIAAGLSLLIPVLFWLFSKQGPTLLYPFPALMFIPSFLLRRAAVLVPVVLFFVWNPGLFGGEAQIPRRSYILLIAATTLSVIWSLLVGGTAWQFRELNIITGSAASTSCGWWFCGCYFLGLAKGSRLSGATWPCIG